MKLICIDRVEEFWPHVSHLIERALEGRGDIAETRSDVMGGFALLWIAWDGALRAAAVTQLTEKDGSKFCTIVACGGKGLDWLHLIGGLEDYARSEGCKAMRIHGREGWKRLLDYRVKSITLEKVL